MRRLVWTTMTVAMFGGIFAAALNTAITPASARDQSQNAAKGGATKESKSAQDSASKANAAKKSAKAEAAAKTTHFLAVGVCPPWKKAKGNEELTKKWAESCRNDVNLITDALSRSLPVRQKNITKLIDEKATYPKVVSAFKTLAQDAKPEDRVVIYMNTHGGEVNAIYKGYPVKDEVFAFYTEKEPSNFQQATVNGPWMTARGVRDMIDTIKAEEIVVIVESCHSGGSFHDFRYDLAGRYRGGWKGREAIIFSAGGDQIANFVKENDKALFTTTFAKVLAGRDQKTLGDAYQNARIETHRDIRKRCLSGPYANKMQLNHQAYLTYCTQKPVAFDPYGLLDDIKLQGRAQSAMLK